MTDQREEPGPGYRLPGRPPDRRKNIERALNIGWSLAGMVMTGGIFTWYLDQRDMVKWPTDELGWLQVVAVATAAVNVGIWMWFPLSDLELLQRWVHTRKRIFPGHTGVFWAIMFQMALLLTMMLGASANAFCFGVAGFAVYMINFIGFVYIRRHLGRALIDSRELYSEQAQEVRSPLSRVLRVIEDHWTTGRSGLQGWQQKRHFTLALVFGGVALLGILPFPPSQIAAYGAGILALISGEVVIAVRRIRRDGVLKEIEEELGLEDA